MSIKEQAFSLYQLLNVPKTATEDQIKKSYRQLALQLHPDKNPDPLAKDRFQKVSDAYKILIDKEQRKCYDETGLVEGMDEFQDAFQFFRNMYPRVTIDDLKKFEKEYRYSKEEEQDLLNFYKQQKGDVKKILENIILSVNEDIPRFIQFFEEQIQSGSLEDCQKFHQTKNKVKKLKEQPRLAKKAEQDLIEAIRNNNNRQRNFVEEEEEEIEVQPKKKVRKQNGKLVKQKKYD